MRNNNSILSHNLFKLQTLWKDRKNQSIYIRWLFSFSKPYIPRIILIMLINLSGSLIAIGMALITKEIIDRATIRGGGISWLVMLYIVCLLLSLVAGIVVQAVTVVLNERFTFGIRRQIYEKITNSHWMDMQRYHTGDLSTRLTSDADNIADGIIGVIPDIIKLMLEFIVIFFTLFYFSPLIAVFGLSVAPVAALVSLVLGRALKRIQVRVQQSEAEYRSFMQESLAHLLILKSFSNEGYAANRLAELRDKRFYWVLKKTKVNIAASTSMSLAFQMGFIVAFAYGATQVSRQVITFGTMSVFMNLASRVQAPIYMMAQKLPRLASIMASAGRVIELQDVPLEEKLPETIIGGQVGFSMNNISFSYDDDGEPIFDNASIEIFPGEFVAVLGESGIGKTTFIRLVMSLVRNNVGNISFYDDYGNVEIAHAGSRKFMSYVPQGNSLFSGSIRENLRMGKLSATEDEMLEALKLASAYDFVMSLPRGLDTIIGERGHGLSEGQAQRIALARAVIKKAPLLILDEATSALDEKTEFAVLNGIKNLNPQPTCIFITHRLSVKYFCDRAIIIDAGKLRSS